MSSCLWREARFPSTPVLGLHGEAQAETHRLFEIVFRFVLPLSVGLGRAAAQRGRGASKAEADSPVGVIARLAGQARTRLIWTGPTLP